MVIPYTAAAGALSGYLSVGSAAAQDITIRRCKQCVQFGKPSKIGDLVRSDDVVANAAKMIITGRAGAGLVYLQILQNPASTR